MGHILHKNTKMLLENKFLKNMTFDLFFAIDMKPGLTVDT